MLNKQLYRIYEEVESTNKMAKMLLSNGELDDKMMIRADYQTQGMGQRGGSWESKKGENLLVTIILIPDFLPLGKQFYLSRVAALAITDFLCVKISDKIQIKWPNDILVGKEKIAGILIENSVQNGKILNSVIGVGINLNQSKFKTYQPSATSLYNLTFAEFDVEQCANLFYQCLMNRYDKLKAGYYKILLNDFNALLYGKDEMMSYKVNGEKIKGQIIEVKDSGELVIQDRSGNISEFSNKEIEYLFI